MLVNNLRLRRNAENARAAGRNSTMRLNNANKRASGGKTLNRNARLGTRNSNMKTCVKARSLGCDAQRLLRFQMECGLYARMLQVNRKTGNGTTEELHSLLCVASPGAGKTLAQWCVCINWCVYEALNSVGEMVTILMVADDEQVKGQANEVPKLVPLLRKTLATSNTEANNLLTDDAITKFLNNLPSKKTVLTKGNIKRNVKGSNVGSTVLPPFKGKYTENNLGESEKIFAAVGGDLDPEYIKIVNTVRIFYDGNLVPWVDACLSNNGSALSKYKLGGSARDVLGKLKVLKARLQKTDSKWESVMNLNAYIQTIIEVARGNKGPLGDVKRLEGDELGKIQRGDLVRFYLRDTLRTGNGSIARPTPYYYVNYWRVHDRGLDVLVTPLCNSSDDVIANLPQHFGWDNFIKLFQVDQANVYRFEYVPNAEMSIVDQPLGSRGGGDEKKLYDLSNDNVRRLLNDKYGVQYKLDKDSKMWWMRYGNFRPTWWKEYPETPWPMKSDSHPWTHKYPHKSDRSVRQGLPSVLIVGMTHSEFNMLHACRSKKAWGSTLIICDEIHQFEEKNAAATLRHAISLGAKSVDFTATPYHDAEDFAVLCGTLGGKNVSKPKSYSKGQATNYAKEHGVLVYNHDMTSGKYDSLMPSLYPNLANQSRAMPPTAGKINVQRAILNYARNATVNTKFSGVVDPSIDPSKQTGKKKTKYPFERISSKPKKNAKANGTFMKKNGNNYGKNYYYNNIEKNGYGKYNNEKNGYGKYNNENNGYGKYNNEKNGYGYGYGNKNNGKIGVTTKNGKKLKAARLLNFEGATKNNRKRLREMHDRILGGRDQNNNTSLSNAQWAPLKRERDKLRKKRANEKEAEAGVNHLVMMMKAHKKMAGQ